MGGYRIENDSRFRYGNGRGYGKIERDGGFRSGNGGGTESGGDTEVGMDSKSTVDTSGVAAGAEASTGSRLPEVMWEQTHNRQ